MSDVQPGSKPTTNGVRVAVDRELFLKACAARGANTSRERAKLLGIPQKLEWQYEHGKVSPNLLAARSIANILGVKVHEVWPENDTTCGKAAA